MHRKKIVLIQSTLGHYHYPRLINLAGYSHDEGFTFDNIELTGLEISYPWFHTKTQPEYSNICLFPDDQLEKISNAKLWKALKAQLERINPDVVFILGYSLGIMRKAKYWCDQHKIATVLISDSNQFDKKRYLPIEFLKYLFVRKFDAAFVAGQSSSAYMQNLGIPAERIVWGCDVVDVKAISNQEQSNKQIINQIRGKWNLPYNYFLFVGRLIPEKNVLGLLSAFERFLKIDESNENWHLVIVGAGEEQNKIDLYIRHLLLRHKNLIHLKGFVSPENIVDLFSCASYFILPSVAEPWGLVVNEAMACSLPLILSDKVGSSHNLIHEGENGWIIDPLNTEMIANILNTAANLDENTRLKLGQRSRTIINDWDLDRFSMGIINCSKIAISYAHNKYKR